MTKLDGNDRWKTKMITPEYADEYEEGGKKEGSGMLTIEERTMIRDLILLPHIDTMVSKSMKEVERSGNILTKMYLMAGRYLQNRVMKDTYTLQKELRQRNVRFVEDEQDDFVSYYKIFFRGYQEQFGITRDVMRSEISIRLTKYTAELGAILKDHLK